MVSRCLALIATLQDFSNKTTINQHHQPQGLRMMCHFKRTKKMRPTERITPTMIDTRDQFLRLVCEELKISPLDVMSKRRDSRTSMARHLIMWGLHQYTEATTTQIGQLMGRDHATVCYGIGAVETNVTMPITKRQGKY